MNRRGEGIPCQVTVQERRAKWVEALRSGKYAQTRRTLYRPDATQFDPVAGAPYPAGFCCLGVAIECGAIPNGAPRGVGGCIGVDATLSAQQLHSLGLTFDDQADLVAMNDREHKTFNEIAEVIERLPISTDLYPDDEGGGDI